MSRRPQRELEQAPHHVYKHYNTGGRLIYVGLTSDPANRPTEAKGRPWIKTESSRVEVSPAMPYDVAVWVERSLIRDANPKHNTANSAPALEPLDDRIDRICEATGCTRGAARFTSTYLPTTEPEFTAALERRKQLAAS